MWPSSFWPWKPATMTTWPESRCSKTFFGVMLRIFALVWSLSVTMPACAPVSETAGTPSAVQRQGGERDGLLLAGGEEDVDFARGWRRG